MLNKLCPLINNKFGFDQEVAQELFERLENDY